jgi:hypothetical protein
MRNDVQIGFLSYIISYIDNLMKLFSRNVLCCNNRLVRHVVLYMTALTKEDIDSAAATTTIATTNLFFKHIFLLEKFSIAGIKLHRYYIISFE